MQYVTAIIVINDNTGPALHVYSGSSPTYNLHASKLLGRSFLTWTENQAAHSKTNSYTVRGLSKPLDDLKLFQKGTSMIQAKETVH